MVPSVLHLVVAVVLAALTVHVVSTFGRTWRATALVVAAVGVGLVYDNAILGLGRFIEHGDLLRGLSVPRFVIHALLTPLLLVAGRGLLEAWGVAWAGRPQVRLATWAVSLGLVGWGVVTDIVRLELEAQEEAGVVSYGNAAATLPVPAMVTIVGLIAAGGVLWAARRWPWLAVGSAVMLITSGLGSISGLITNVGELSLIGSLAATERATRGRQDRGDAEPEIDLRATASSPATGTAGTDDLAPAAGRSTSARR